MRNKAMRFKSVDPTVLVDGYEIDGRRSGGLSQVMHSVSNNHQIPHATQAHFLTDICTERLYDDPSHSTC